MTRSHVRLADQGRGSSARFGLQNRQRLPGGSHGQGKMCSQRVLHPGNVSIPLLLRASNAGICSESKTAVGTSLHTPTKNVTANYEA